MDNIYFSAYSYKGLLLDDLLIQINDDTRWDMVGPPKSSNSKIIYIKKLPILLVPNFEKPQL